MSPPDDLTEDENTFIAPTNDEILPASDGNWVLIVDGIVAEKRPYKQNDEFILAPDDVVPGYIYTEDENFVAPEANLNNRAYEARKLRDTLLASSDWTQIADAPLSLEVKEQWRFYRSELRAIPSQQGFPENILWPEKPE